jgi:hypothetical protein
MNLLACPSLGDFVWVVFSLTFGWLFAGGLFVAGVVACVEGVRRGAK